MFLPEVPNMAEPNHDMLKDTARTVWCVPRMGKLEQFSLTDEQVKKGIVEEFGVEPYSILTNTVRGWSFVSFKTPEEADKAIQKSHTENTKLRIERRMTATQEKENTVQFRLFPANGNHIDPDHLIVKNVIEEAFGPVHNISKVNWKRSRATFWSRESAVKALETGTLSIHDLGIFEFSTWAVEGGFTEPRNTIFIPERL
eukprot:TRINITY_DN22282_c0_g1_i1.p1 TRINITY_DN22282_c0_g1~~TRINITY_DN22282_c0_g1_i1.p1  ORF type:complete len:228 (-),score=8.23 TRINITY_DN22282_c0_g1_i1:39-638(-)